MSEAKDPGSYGKFDVFVSDDRELEREMLLARPMVVRCANCDFLFEGPSKEGVAAFRDHARTVHGLVFKQKKKKGVSKAPFEKSAMSKSESVQRGLIASRGQTLKWTKEALIEWRDAFEREHGRMPTSKERGVDYKAVVREYGSWLNFIDA